MVESLGYFVFRGFATGMVISFAAAAFAAVVKLLIKIMKGD